MIKIRMLSFLFLTNIFLYSCMTMPEVTGEKKDRNIEFYLYENGDPLNLYNIVETECINRGYGFHKVLDGTRVINSENTNRQITGSGFVISNEGFVITNAHVVEESENLIVVKEEKEYKANIISIDKVNDLALLQVAELKNTNYLSLISLNEKKVGEKIYCIGFPLNSVLGNEPRITDGIISAKTGITGINSIFQISAPIQPGNSGGPVIDENCNVIGVVVSKLDDLYGLKYNGSIPQNVNFAIKSDLVMALFSDYIKNNSSIREVPAAIDCTVLIKNSNNVVNLRDEKRKYVLEIQYVYNFDLIHYTLSAMQIYIVNPNDGEIIDSIKWTGESFSSADTITKVLINRLLNKLE